MNQTNPSKDSLTQTLQNLEIDIGPVAALGIVTFGIYWGLYFAEWSRRHQKYRSAVDSSRSSEGSQIVYYLGTAAAFGPVAIIVLLVVAYCVEEVFHSHMPSGEWFFIPFTLLSLFMLPVTWATLLYQLRYLLHTDLAAIEAQRVRGDKSVSLLYLRRGQFPWLLDGNEGRIARLAVIHCCLAVGLLPLFIFPPLAAGAINKYLHMQRLIHVDQVQPVAGAADEINHRPRPVGGYMVTVSPDSMSIACPACGEELEVGEDDIHNRGFKCPTCQNDIGLQMSA